MEEKAIVLNRTWYKEYCPNPSENNRYKSQRQETDLKFRGWNSVTNKAYEPFGEMSNIFKGCKIVQKKFRNYNLEFEIPVNKSNISFLKGSNKLLDFVMEEKEKKMGTAVIPRYSNTLRFGKTTKFLPNNKFSQTKVGNWLRKMNRERKNSCANKGSLRLREQLVDSFYRLNEVRKGKLLSEVFSPTASSGVTKNIPLHNLHCEKATSNSSKKSNISRKSGSFISDKRSTNVFSGPMSIHKIKKTAMSTSTNWRPAPALESTVDLSMVDSHPQFAI